MNHLIKIDFVWNEFAIKHLFGCSGHCSWLLTQKFRERSSGTRTASWYYSQVWLLRLNTTTGYWNSVTEWLQNGSSLITLSEWPPWKQQARLAETKSVKLFLKLWSSKLGLHALNALSDQRIRFWSTNCWMVLATTRAIPPGGTMKFIEWLFEVK